ncbi:DAK2 domain-containing protein [Dactylosporangium sucinum]|uniref:Dihydroxyacetone kinase subunit L n=1 Tax=Dactylosporangium sucinum TaxID=1424081 RepID=A0A917WX89_9ACTN|nr:DAK2 domain-containing protein [Dactylosporangium sucinum]GGM36545.1 dihydroxyacetone kinase subunit L [Dactylosporangium sucinum]
MLMRTYLDLTTEAHASLTAMDQAAGDGDFGDNLRDALRLVDSRMPDDAGLAVEFAVAATCFLDEVGGTSGPLIGLLLQEIAAALAAAPAGRSEVDDALVAGLAAGIAAVQRVGEAQVGDRTMLDSLVPALDLLTEAPRPVDWAAVAAEARRAAEATAGLKARMGRASYVGERALGTPDAGAVGMALFFAALAQERTA